MISPYTTFDNSSALAPPMANILTSETIETSTMLTCIHL